MKGGLLWRGEHWTVCLERWATVEPLRMTIHAYGTGFCNYIIAIMLKDIGPNFWTKWSEITNSRCCYMVRTHFFFSHAGTLFLIHYFGSNWNISTITGMSAIKLWIRHSWFPNHAAKWFWWPHDLFSPWGRLHICGFKWNLKTTIDFYETCTGRLFMSPWGWILITLVINISPNSIIGSEVNSCPILYASHW